MDTVSTFAMLMSTFDPALTVPTAANLAVLARGAVLSPRKRTVAACLMAAWPWVRKGYDTYNDLLRRARLNTLWLASLLLELGLRLVPEEAPVKLAVDETLVRRWGPRVRGLGMHRDPVRSCRSRHAVNPGHRWVTLSLIVSLPYMGRVLALPIVSALYTPRSRPSRNRSTRLYRRHRTVGDLALLLMRLIVRRTGDRSLILVGDGAYATHQLSKYLQPDSPVRSLRGVSLVSRFYFDGATYKIPAPYSGRGRPRIVGEKLPSPRAVVDNPETEWERAVLRWYGRQQKLMWLCSRTGLWYKGGEGAKWIRWVVVRDPAGKRRDEVFFTTDRKLSAAEIVETYVGRWSIETTFEEAREHLGLETLRNWSSTAVRRSVPLLLGLYSMIVIWFHLTVEKPENHCQQRPWYAKAHLTFSDMLAAARSDILGELLYKHPGSDRCEQLLWRLSCGSAGPARRRKRNAA